jgi:hypothetical protein
MSRSASGLTATTCDDGRAEPRLSAKSWCITPLRERSRSPQRGACGRRGRATPPMDRPAGAAEKDQGSRGASRRWPV